MRRPTAFNRPRGTRTLVFYAPRGTRTLVRHVSMIALPTAIVLAAVLLVPRRAESEPAPRFPVDQPVPVTARVALLEQRVHGLEQRLKAFEKLSVKAQADGGYVLVANGARVQIARDGSVTVTSAPAAGATTAR